MITIIGDLHLKSLLPYWLGLQKLMGHIFSEYKDSTLIFTGDVFDTSSPKWDVFTLFMKYCRQHPNQIYIVHGNHEYSQLKGSSLTALSELSNVEVITYKKEVFLEGLKFLMLPYRYDWHEMKAYEKITDHYDYVVTHITPVKYQFYTEGILLNCKAKAFFHGHIHVCNEFTDDNGILNIVVSVPQTTRNGEQSEKKRVIQVDKAGWKSVDLPIYMEISDVKYGEFPENKEDLLNIYDAPSKKMVSELYRDYYIRDRGTKFIETEKTSSLDIEDKVFKLGSLEEAFGKYAEEEDKISDDIKACIYKYFEMIS